MGSVPPKQDIVFPAIMILAISLALVNVALSYYATENFVMLIFDYPISVAYQAAYPGVVSLLVAPAYLFMKRPRSAEGRGRGDGPRPRGRGLRPRGLQHLPPLAVDWRGAGLHPGDARDCMRGALGSRPAAAGVVESAQGLGVVLRGRFYCLSG